MIRKLALLLAVLLMALVVWAAAQNNYATAFPSVENPISEGGNWINGGAPWASMQTFGGRIGGTNNQPGCSGSTPDGCTDSHAALAGTWTSDQAACATVILDVGSSTNRSAGVSEVEIHLRRTISAGQSKGYEFNYSLNSTGPYGQIVRWDGVVGGHISFAVLPGGFVGAPALQNGDVFCASAIGSTLKSWMLRGGVVQASTTATDATYAGGAPGVGTFNAGTLANNSTFGLSQFEATNLAAQTAAQPDVNAVINGPLHTVSNGESVLMPPGTPTWTTGVTIPGSTGVRIYGYGVPNSSPGQTGASASCGATALTINTNAAAVFIATPIQTSSLLGLSCFAENLQPGTSSRGFNFQATCNVTCPSVRIDNITFNNWQTSPHQAGISFGIGAIGDMFGVLDHNTIAGGTSPTAGFNQLAEISHASYLGAGLWGDNSWAQPENYGSNQFVFIENNSFANAGCCENEANAGQLNQRGGSRVVSRFNSYTTFDNVNFGLGWHGTESSGRPRSGRVFEYYGNSNHYPAVCNPTQSGNCPPIVAVRGGTGLAWGNTVNAASPNFNSGVIGLNFLRAFAAINWPACDGTAPEDGNDPSANASSPAFIGLVSAVNGGVITITTMIGGNPGWTTNQWSPAGAPYSLHDVNWTTTKGLSVGAEIDSNTGNAVTLPSFQSFYISPVVGDTVWVTRAFWCMDQSTRGKGSPALNSLQSSPNTPPFPASNEVLSPTYAWMNLFTSAVPGGGQSGLVSDTLHIVRNRDYYTENTNQLVQSNATTPFNGTTASGGIGHGTKANLPSTCTTGVGYWATDEGNWNQSGNGFGQGNLYLCTATNTWTLSYTPFCYPHFLVSNLCSGSAGAPLVSLSPSSVPFGSVLVGSSATQNVTLSNPGTATLNIASIAASANPPFSQTNNCSSALFVGGSCTIVVKFTPGSATSFSGSLTVTDNAAGSPQTVSLSGTGVTASAGVSFSPTSLTFPGQTVGTSSSPQSVTVTNTGSGNLIVTGVAPSGGASTSFSQTNNCTTVAPSSTCTINVTFTPQSAGALASQICVTDNAPASPQCFNIGGTGTATGNIGFNPASLTFANQAVGTTSAAQTITVSNSGGSPITITSIAVTGTNASNFAQSNNCGASLAAGSSCTVSVTFTPSANGSRTASVTFTDSAAGSPQSVALSGTGFTPTAGIGFSPTNLTFSSQTVGTSSAPQAVTVTNTGSGTLTISGVIVSTGAATSFSQTNNCGSVAPAGTCTINVTFTPQAVGALASAVLVTDNAAGSPQSVPLSGTGAAVGSLTFNPASITFPNQAVSTTSVASTITVTNVGGTTVTISSIAITGTNASNFAQTNNCGASIGAGGSCMVSVTFTPSANGSRTASVSFTDSAPSSPQSVSLQGTGFTPAPAVTLSVSSIAFGNQTVGTQSNPQVVILTNTGTATLTVSTATMGGANPGDFGFSTTCSASLAVNASCTYSLTFAPTAGGSRSATFSVNTNAASTPDNVSLTGTGMTSPPGAPAPQVFGD